ncbi:cold-shock protein [Rhodovibrionaceae bacterium A322]
MTENTSKHLATVKSYNATRGFGFVRVEDIDIDIFFHRSVMDDAGISHLQGGDQLQCEIKPVPRGYQVVSIASVSNGLQQGVEQDLEFAPLIRRRPLSPVGATNVRPKNLWDWGQRSSDQPDSPLLGQPAYPLGGGMRFSEESGGQESYDQPAAAAVASPPAANRPVEAELRPPLSEEEKDDLDHQGILKWFDRTKGFGFIVDDDTGRDVFMHVTAFTRSGFDMEDIPEPGTEMIFSVKPAPQGIQVDCFAYL